MGAPLARLLVIASSMTPIQLVQRFGFIGGLLRLKLSFNPRMILFSSPGGERRRILCVIVNSEGILHQDDLLFVLE